MGGLPRVVNSLPSPYGFILRKEPNSFGMHLRWRLRFPLSPSRGEERPWARKGEVAVAVQIRVHRRLSAVAVRICSGSSNLRPPPSSGGPLLMLPVYTHGEGGSVPVVQWKPARKIGVPWENRETLRHRTHPLRIFFWNADTPPLLYDPPIPGYQW